MANIEISFLGEKYSVSEDLLSLVKATKKFETINDKLTDLLIKQIKKNKHCGQDFQQTDKGPKGKYYKTAMEDAAKEIIKDLSEQQIYNVTITELVDENDGYIEMEKVCQKTFETSWQILIKAIQNFQAGYQGAYTQLSSQITGTGVSVYTSSPSSFLLYSALEASVVNKQFNRAKTDYQKALDNLIDSNQNEMERDKSNLLKNYYYPNISSSLSMFVSILMKKYLKILSENGKFDYSVTETYNLAKSCDILKNYDLVTDKTALLKQAFICCPYNPDVYQKVIELNNWDYPTFETLKYFEQSSLLVSDIRKELRLKINSPKEAADIVRVLSLLEDCAEKDIWNDLYCRKVSAILEGYSKLRGYLSNSQKLKSFILAGFPRNIETASKEEISDYVKEKVLAITNISVIELLKSLDLISIEKISLNANADITFEEMNEEYIESITLASVQFIEKALEEKKALLKSAGELKKQHEDYCSSSNDKLSEEKKMIEELQNQRNNLGFFAFSQKKSLDLEIQNAQAKYDKLKREISQKQNALYDAYENEQKKAEAVI